MAQTFELTVNGTQMSLEADPGTPLLWVLRDALALTGTKFGCGAGLCGSCSVHIDGEVIRSCVYPIEGAEGTAITTIEGLGGEDLHPLQDAWVAESVPQCGYCQPGMVMAVSGYLEANPGASAEEVKENVTNICRCGTYSAIERALARVTAQNGE
jgi:isoquinoline 1-oxidoreductase alpha subunit